MNIMIFKYTNLWYYLTEIGDLTWGSVVTVCFFPFYLPACRVCNLWQSVWSRSCEKCTKCKHRFVFIDLFSLLLFPFFYGLPFKYICRILNLCLNLKKKKSDWEYKTFPKVLKANPFCLLQFNGRAIFGKRPESHSLTVVYFDLDTHPFLVWYSFLYFAYHCFTVILVL